MFLAKVSKNVQRVIWRSSQAPSRGVYDRPAVRNAEHSSPPEVQMSGYYASSLDLLFGADVSESPMGALTAQMYNDLAPSDLGDCAPID
jgi:hypothetical protein